MPLMVFMGTQSRRSDDALRRRAESRRSRSRGCSDPTARAVAAGATDDVLSAESAAVAAKGWAAVVAEGSAAVAAESSSAAVAAVPGMESIIELGKAAAPGDFPPGLDFFV